ncbi:PLDc N-terminal domain-containing protein [Branchiibius sp. NY16-3462-2]|uniref:PLDc N-terminal domain-containing protein n=1 Tax=Branchiibius sp. NY16-3462-2 TaxID=1807500 RepID=UPI00079B5EA2|nr:PLDc N-terminal domain-containing protein [Branchiibius sp. NY16-3462-2]KYH46182.1 hypothetical protein AZH51_11205 [Branchiibius sp. NY16-3462-2]
MHEFWQFLLYVIYIFVFIAYLMIMFQIVVDLFRDHELSGWAKAAWVVGLILIPVLTALVYIIARGDGMARRQMSRAAEAENQARAYIRDAAGRSPAQEISDAKQLLDSGAITPDQYEVLKTRALSI